MPPAGAPSTRALGVSGRIAAYFQAAQITPLLGLLALLLGAFAVAVTPREEEPQINGTMANVLIAFPGAAVREVEQMAGVEHVMSESHPGLAVVTVQFKVGVPRPEALLGRHLAAVKEVTDYQACAGAAAPINFNGLVRQYDRRASAHLGDLQVNLVDKHLRSTPSHAIAMRERPALQAIGQCFGANVRVVEVPPGPPVLAPIVAEIHGPDAAGRMQVARAVRGVFERRGGVVDVDESSIAAAPRTVLQVDRRRAAQLGVAPQDVVHTLHAGLAGEAVSYLHDGSKYPAAATLQLPGEQHGNLEALLQLRVRSAAGKLVPVSELVTPSNTLREQPAYHKDLLPVSYVVADMAGAVDSPLYGMFAMRAGLAALPVPGGGTLQERFITPPTDPYRAYTLKWDDEWQITCETFRDMGAAYAVGLVLIYLLVVARTTHFAHWPGRRAAAGVFHQCRARQPGG